MNYSFAGSKEHHSAWWDSFSKTGVRLERGRLLKRLMLYWLDVHLTDKMRQAIGVWENGRGLRAKLIWWHWSRHSYKLHSARRWLCRRFWVIDSCDGFSVKRVMLWVFLEELVVAALNLLHVQLDCFFILANDCRILRHGRLSWGKWQRLERLCEFTLFRRIFDHLGHTNRIFVVLRYASRQGNFLIVVCTKSRRRRYVTSPDTTWKG